mgnify:CR=1 FL=1
MKTTRKLKILQIVPIIIFCLIFSKTTTAQTGIDTTANDTIITDTNIYCFNGIEIKRIAETTLKYEELKKFTRLQDSLFGIVIFSHQELEQENNQQKYNYFLLEKKYFDLEKKLGGKGASEKTAKLIYKSLLA